MNTHSLERTSPKGGMFIGRCVYCGKEGLLIKAVSEPCEKAPDQNQQILDVIKFGHSLGKSRSFNGTD
jgi:hypothetical protein